MPSRRPGHIRMEDELLESLPSHSTFARGGAAAFVEETERYEDHYQSYDYGEVYEDFAEDRSYAGYTREPSPPPPPPPPPVVEPLSHSYVEDDRAATQRSSTAFAVAFSDRPPSSSTGGGARSSPKGPFTFLKKNSRKEPSALNRKPASPSALNASSQNFPSEPPGRAPPSARASSTGADRPPSAAAARSTNNDEVLLGGDDYWGLDSSVAQDLHALHGSRSASLSAVRGPLADPLAESSGTNMSMSTMSLGLNDWRKAPARADDVDEFKALEQRFQPPPAARDHWERDLPYDVGDADPLSQGLRQRSGDSVKSSWGAVTQPALPPRPLSRTYSTSSVASSRDDESDRGARAGAAAGRRTVRDPSPTARRSSTGAASAASSMSSIGRAHEEVKLVRPSSTLRARGPSPAPMPRKAGTSQPRGRAGPSAQTTKAADMQLLLDDKARELEAELETYRAENEKARRLKKQHEVGLAELAQKRDEVLRFCDEEKARTLAWCEEQRAAAEREKRTAAKQARDSRIKAASGTAPIGKQKAETEAMQAALDRAKATHEAAAKKWKLAENRLYSVVKDHCTHIERLEQQVVALEEQKILLLDFVAQSGLRLPKAIRSKVLGSAEANQPPLGSKAKSQTFSQNRRLSERGFVEEVDVEEVMGRPLQRCDDPAVAPARSQSLSAGMGSLASERELRASRAAATVVGRSGKGPVAPDVAASWARSSKSSTRYSSTSLDHDDLGNEMDDAPAIDEANWPMQRVEGAATLSLVKSPAKKVPDPPTALGIVVPSSSSARNPHSPTQPSPSASAPAAGQPSSAENAVGSGRVEESLPDGSKRIHYRNGTMKTVDALGRSFVVFTNGDSKLSDPKSGVVVYYYAQADTTHTTYPDGLEVYEFPNKQMERHHPDGRKEVLFPDRTRKIIEPDGTQESHFPDGVVLREYRDGRKEVVGAGGVA